MKMYLKIKAVYFAIFWSEKIGEYSSPISYPQYQTDTVEPRLSECLGKLV